MLRKYFFVNVILISVAIFAAYKLYDYLSQPLNIPSKIAKKQNAEETKEKDAETPDEKRTDISSFHVIVQKDLFRPGRTEPKMEELKSGPPPAPPPRLVGTVITESGAKAYLEDTATKTTRGFRVKESIAGFILHEIKENSVVLLKGEEKVEIKITRIETVSAPAKTPAVTVPQGGQNLPQPVQPTVQPVLPAQPPHLPTPPPALPVPPSSPLGPIIKPAR